MLVVPDPEVLLPWAEAAGLGTELEALVEREEVQQHYLAQVREVLEGKVASYERPRQVILLAEPFSLEEGTLTQTLKLKRRVVVERYAQRIEAAYSD